MAPWRVRTNLVGRSTLLVSLSILVAGMLATGVTQPARPVHLTLLAAYSPSSLGDVAACGHARPGAVRCTAHIATVDGAIFHQASAKASVGGYGPTDVQSAYKLPAAGGSGQTIALVDAYDNPHAESDLATYRSDFGLPPCTTANGCFRKVDQSGGTSYPAGDEGWGGEIDLDLEAASAACTRCSILLVEANSAYTNDLLTAINEAITLGATEISMSWGGSESSGDPSLNSYFNHPGIAFTAAAGDNGYGAGWPAASPDVTAVGGTTLTSSSSSRGWSESVWSGTGSGCSAVESKPSWQHDAGCGNRTENDVSAVANPNTGLAVYDSFGYGGWVVFGGTSLSSPLVAGTYADGGGEGSDNVGAQPFYHGAAVNDVTSGSNGGCSPSYLCTAGPGYDGPTGLGTPNGPPQSGGSTTPTPTPTSTPTPTPSPTATAKPTPTPTPTPTPPPGGGTFGYTGVGATVSASGMSADYKRGSTYSSGNVSGPLTDVTAYLDGNGGSTGAESVTAAVYNDQTGALIATSPGTSINAGRAAGWVDFRFSSGNIATNTSYRLTLLSGGTAVARYYYGTSGAWNLNSNTYTSGPSNPFGAASETASRSMSIYATVKSSSPSPSPTPTPGPKTTSLKLTSSASSPPINQVVTFTATVSPGYATGTVAFVNSYTPSGGGWVINGCSAVPVNNGVARCNVTFYGAYSRTMYAAFTGTNGYSNSTATMIQNVIS